MKHFPGIWENGDNILEESYHKGKLMYNSAHDGNRVKLTECRRLGSRGSLNNTILFLVVHQGRAETAITTYVEPAAHAERKGETC